jgi:hypothetical protein
VEEAANIPHFIIRRAGRKCSIQFTKSQTTGMFRNVKENKQKTKVAFKEYKYKSDEYTGRH